MSGKLSRRSAVMALAAAPAGVAAGRLSRLTAAGLDPWVDVHPANLRHNVGAVRRRVEGRPILAVIKNSGYGLGHVNVARVLEPEPAILGFAVVKLSEALALRAAGIRKPVLWMGPFEEAELREAVARDIRPMVYTPVGDLLERLAAERGRPVPIHVCVDTGIGRVGVPHGQARALLDDLLGRRGVGIEGVMMTFSEDGELDREQIRRFESLLAPLRQTGAPIGMRHAVSSFGLFERPDAFLDLVRPGMALYGVYSELPFRDLGLLDLRPSLALRCRVAYVKRLEAGESAGYSRAFVAREPTWVATLPMGHVDGVPRVVVKGAKLKVNGALYPAVAVSASHTIVALGPEPTARAGDVATLFDWEAGSRPEDVAQACGASVYDLLMHLDPTLPRRIVE